MSTSATRRPGEAQQTDGVARPPVRTSIAVQGARVHNLKNITVEIPRDQLTVVTGLSGSGKSSLAFDTVYAEGQRRYMESLSSYAKRFIAQVEKPDVDFVYGLSPVVSIEQKTIGRNPRSTVGTLTDIASYLNLLFATIGEAYCPYTDEPVPVKTGSQILESLLKLPEGAEVELRAPIFQSTARTRSSSSTRSASSAAATWTSMAARRLSGSTSRRTSPTRCRATPSCRPWWTASSSFRASRSSSRPASNTPCASATR